MKLGFLVLVLCLIPILVVARDLNAIAKRERARRQSLAHSQPTGPSRTFRDADLEVYRRLRPDSKEARRHAAPRTPLTPSRDLAKERRHWRKETTRHERELAKLDAQIRRLEHRLAGRKAQRRPGERLREDPMVSVLEDSIEALAEERRRQDESFHERARKAGALPGWLR